MSSVAAMTRRLSLVPFWVVAALVVLHASSLVMEHVLGVTDRQPWRFLHHQFHLDREVNVASWAATLLLVAASALLGTIAFEGRLTGDRRRGYWAGLAIIFLLLSLDEMCSFHERLSEPVGARLQTGGILTNAWVIVVVPVLGVMFIAFVPFLGALPASTRWRLIAAGALFVGGAAGVELFSGLLRERYGYDDARFAAATTLEELLELLGVAFFLRALVLYMAEARTLERLVVESGADVFAGKGAGLGEGTAPRPRAQDASASFSPSRGGDAGASHRACGPSGCCADGRSR